MTLVLQIESYRISQSSGHSAEHYILWSRAVLQNADISKQKVGPTVKTETEICLNHTLVIQCTFLLLPVFCWQTLSSSCALPEVQPVLEPPFVLWMTPVTSVLATCKSSLQSFCCNSQKHLSHNSDRSAESMNCSQYSECWHNIGFVARVREKRKHETK